MNASLNFITASLSVEFNSMRYCRKLEKDNLHLYLPMISTVTYAGKSRTKNESQPMNSSYYSPSSTSTTPILDSSFLDDSFYRITEPPTTFDQSNATYIHETASKLDSTPPSTAIRAVRRPPLTNHQLHKFHLQLQHGSHNQMKNYLKSSNLWHEGLNSRLQAILAECPCILASPPKPRPLLSSTPPNSENHGEIAVDII